MVGLEVIDVVGGTLDSIRSDGDLVSTRTIRSTVGPVK